MPRWVILLIVGPLVLCVSCASLGYFVLWPRITSEMQSALSAEMANALDSSISAKIVRSDPAANRLVLTSADLNVNNVDSSADCGFEHGTDGTFIYGVETDINPAGIFLTCGVTYSSIPVVLDGQVDMTDSQFSLEAAEFLLSKDAVEEGLEKGINRALTSHGLRPTAIAFFNGLMVIAFTRPS